MLKYAIALTVLCATSSVAFADESTPPTPRYIIKSDGVIYDCLTGLPVPGQAPSDDEGDDGES